MEEQKENIDYVICKICGLKLKSINGPHVKKHGLTTNTYMNKFTEAVMVPEKVKNLRNSKLVGQKRTEETKKKLSTSLKDSWNKNPNQGRSGCPLPDQSKAALSKKMTGHFVSEETRKKISLKGVGRQPWNVGLTKNDDYRLKNISEKTSAWNKIFFTADKREQISQTLKQKYAAGMKIPCAKNGYRVDIGMSFRSTWEANFARILKNNNIAILYEHDTFVFKDTEGYIITVYRPDFKTGLNQYVEIKGHAMSSSSWLCNCKRCQRDKYKHFLMSQQYPEVKIIIIGKSEYKNLSNQFKPIIENWEK